MKNSHKHREHSQWCLRPHHPEQGLSDGHTRFFIDLVLSGNQSMVRHVTKQLLGHRWQALVAECRASGQRYGPLDYVLLGLSGRNLGATVAGGR